jgi:hypothetical protein
MVRDCTGKSDNAKGRFIHERLASAVRQLHMVRLPTIGVPNPIE